MKDVLLISLLVHLLLLVCCYCELASLDHANFVSKGSTAHLKSRRLESTPPRLAVPRGAVAVGYALKNCFVSLLHEQRDSIETCYDVSMLATSQFLDHLPWN